MLRHTQVDIALSLAVYTAVRIKRTIVFTSDEWRSDSVSRPVDGNTCRAVINTN
jgi:hypothetical protein